MDIDEQELYFGVQEELLQNKNLIRKIANKDEKTIKNICKFASGRLVLNEFSKMYNEILKKENWSTKQRRVVLLQLLNNLSNQDLEDCIKKGDDKLWIYTR